MVPICTLSTINQMKTERDNAPTITFPIIPQMVVEEHVLAGVVFFVGAFEQSLNKPIRRWLGSEVSGARNRRS